MRWLFPGQEVRIDSTCLDCGEPLHVTCRDEELVEVFPAETVAHTVTSFMARSEASSAFR